MSSAMQWLERVVELEAEVERLRRALTEIANTDFRGNRSQESQIAYRALQTNALEGSHTMGETEA